jgi:hypothetical protein
VCGVCVCAFDVCMWRVCVHACVCMVFYGACACVWCVRVSGGCVWCARVCVVICGVFVCACVFFFFNFLLINSMFHYRYSNTTCSVLQLYIVTFI